MKNIVVLGTGGTISGKGAAGKTHGYKPGQMSIDDMIRDITGITELANIRGVQVLNTASDNITGKDLIGLARTINELSADPNIDGFVLTHGTDTLEETAFFLHLTVKTEKPIVITGSMRPSTANSADGPQNLYQAVALAASDEAYGKGVMVVFSDAIYSAREVTKVNTFRTDGFSGRDFGCIGYLRDSLVEFISSPAKPHTVNTPFDVTDITELPTAEIAYFYLDANPEIPRLMLESSEAIVIAGAGNGGFSIEWRDKILSKQYSDKAIIVASRIGNGSVVKHPSLPDNCIGSGSLNPQKARILLQLALTTTKNINDIKRIFSTY